MDCNCQNQRVLSVSFMLPWIPLYRLQLDLDFIYSVAEIFYLYLINEQLNFCPISNSTRLV